MTPDDPNQRPPYTYLRRGRWFWEPPPRLRGPSHKTVALGADQATAWTVARGLNRQLAGEGNAAPGTVRWLFDQWEASDKFASRAASTQKDYRWLARLLSSHQVGGVALGELPAKALRARHADKIHADLAAKHGAATGHYACRFARRVWNWGRRQEAVTDNPWAGMELAGLAARHQRWTREQVEACIAAAEKAGWRSVGLAVRLAWRLGLRQQDVLGLTWTQLEARLVDTRKTGAAVPVVAEAYPDLRRALKATARTAVQVVVCEGTGQAWGADYFRHVFREVAGAAGIPAELQFRDLRATAVTELADAGADVVALSTHSGHETTQMARRYARRTPEQFEAAARLRLARERKGR